MILGAERRGQFKHVNTSKDINKVILFACDTVIIFLNTPAVTNSPQLGSLSSGSSDQVSPLSADVPVIIIQLINQAIRK